MKPYLGLVFISRAFHFTDRLEKRVKSRLTAKSITLMRPQGEKIIRIYIKRFSVLKDLYEVTLAKQKSNKQKCVDQHLKTKILWVKRIMNEIESGKAFKELVSQSINSINNQFITCMKIAVIKSLQLHHVNSMPDHKFSQAFVAMLQDAALHIAPNYYKNLIIRIFFL